MNSRLITKAAKWALAIMTIAMIISIYLNISQINLLNNYFEENLYSEELFLELANKNDLTVQRFSAVYLFIFILSALLVARWLYISAKINHALGKKGLTITPGWSIGWYFIPFANLVMPYLSLQETYLASFEKSDWKNGATPAYFPIWWFPGLLAGILDRVATMQILELGESYEYTELNMISYLEISSGVLGILSTICLFKIILAISKNHRHLDFDLVLKEPQNKAMEDPVQS